ncbi:heavy metal sensor histidine kinase [Pseudoalteromonas sp. MIP2626]|uniref:heavy metal sensor histidine kinase n=1 Tax=Pseudoalteromonas sp. MIP2626 TaxID=2705464 RepID=UPI0017BD84B7|nr:heavy metal sensor histidine kinase [Pseudoalteromonas sp. MIP2626]NYR13074.1 heavy metal sensor histidine kinase [Pseudoalteromonas sp. MIP2626]
MPKINARPMSLTMRVVLFIAVTVIACLTLVASLINSSIEHHFIEQDSGELKVISQSVAAVLAQQHSSSEPLGQALSKAVAGHHGVYYQVNSQQGALIYQSSGRDFTKQIMSAPSALGFNRDNIVHWQANDHTYRALVSDFNVQQQHYKITAAIDMSFYKHFLRQFKQSLWVIMFGSAVLILLVAWFAVHQGLNPLRGLSKKIYDIQTHKMDVRLDESKVPIELVNMVHSFNAMLDRLQDEFMRLSNFSTDIAHELRTPLTNIITQTQVGLTKQRDLVQYQELLFSNLEELERLTKMVSDMLWLAKTQNGLIKAQQQVLQSDEEIDALLEYFDAVAEDANITFIKQGSNVEFYCEQLHFRQLLSNLLSNAIRYTPAGESITISSERTGNDQVCIAVTNPGEKIAAEHLPYLFDRFYRADKSRQRQGNGAGLGLAIVKALVTANGGNIVVTSNANTRFKVFFKHVKS